ncbi:unnamed protein product [Arabidopsis halleri]
MSQQKYAEDLLVLTSMVYCTPLPTPLPVQLDRVPNQQELFTDPSYFRSIAGKLQYLTLTRPDIQFAVNYVCQKMHQPTLSDFHLLKRILRYIRGTTTMGINYSRGESSAVLTAYSDSDWENCKGTRRSVGGFCTFMGRNLISWSSKKQPTVSRSSTEAEYRSLTDTACEIKWMSTVLRELGIPLQYTPQLFCDNLSAVYFTANPAFHARTKHFDIDYHYVRERVALKTLIVKHIPGFDQIADIFTKSLPFADFTRLRIKLGVTLPPTPSLRGTINIVQQLKMGLAKMKPRNQIKEQRSSPSKRSLHEASSQTDKTRAGKEKAATAKDCTEKQFNVKLANRFSALDVASAA